MGVRVVSSFLVVIVCICYAAGNKDVMNCSFTDPTTGKTFDMSPLIASNGSYMWTEGAYAINGFGLDSLISDVYSNYTFALQVCRNIEKKPHPNCNTTGSAFMIFQDTCVSFGNADIAAFQPNPLGDGVFLAQYHGQILSHIARYSSHIYFVCDPTTMMKRPIFEHINTALKAAHFKIFTKLAC